MEIISYVGAVSASRNESSRLHVSKPSVSFSPRKPSPFRTKRYAAKTDVLAVRKSRFSAVCNLRLFTRASFYRWLLPTLAICVFVPLALFRLADYVESHANPVVFPSLPQTELDFLNTAMARFAMEHGGDSVDENGNVLADDGSVLSASTVGVGKAISYASYTVAAGDTISGISKKFGLGNISTLIAVNDIDNVRSLRSGQKLRVPNQDGVVHRVAKGDSINAISVAYHVSVEEILDANDIETMTLSVGQELFIPGAKMDATSLKKAMGELFTCPIKAAWRLTSRFGIRNDPFTGIKSSHTGVDMACPTGTPIYAAMSGKVVVAGWSNVFGNYVIINHENGYQTLYGHLSKRIAQQGQRVSQGTRIGLAGSTGYSTGPHLHFTVYKNGKLVDPLTLLK
ncbi:MAG: M23 family metallopeptidase [Treponemataceae bacterium]|nr:M23 family metallopeptidase [Treponemataceae bacterium]